jgi:hypothetical protein
MRGFIFWERAKLALLSGQNVKPSRRRWDEVFVSPLVGVSGSPKVNPFLSVAGAKKVFVTPLVGVSESPKVNPVPGSHE